MRRSKLLKFIIPSTAGIFLTACGSGNDTSEKPASVERVKVTQPVASVVEPKPATKAVVKEVSTEEAMLKRGRIVWFKCRSCHELGVDGPHKVGPNLNGLMDAEAAKKEGFVYSKALVEANLVWDDATLDAFIMKPASYVKGTKMAFVGIKKESDRKALIEYIRKESKAP